MAFQSAPQVAEAVIQGSISGQPIANVVNFRLPGGYSQADIDNLASVVDLWVSSTYLPLVANSVTYVQTLVRGLENVIDLTATDGSGAGAGTLTGSGMPANATLCITLRSGFTGRSARGRFYGWPFSSSVLLTSQTVTTTYATNLANAVALLKTDAAAFNWVMSILSRRTVGTLRPTAIATPVTNVVARNNEVDSQRHRLLRGH